MVHLFTKNAVILLWVTCYRKTLNRGIKPGNRPAALQSSRHVILHNVQHPLPFRKNVHGTAAAEENLTKKNGVHFMHSVGKSASKRNYIALQPLGMAESDVELGRPGTPFVVSAVPATPSLRKLLVCALVVPKIWLPCVCLALIA
jgi:hypothetical protein